MKKISKKLTASFISVILLIGCLCVVTYALIYSAVSVDDNLFQTGTIQINLNDGKPVIEENEYLFEPGVTVVKEFFLENEGTCDVYYKLYLENMDGGLADVLEVSIQDGDTVLYQGTAAELTKDNTSAADDVLEIGERRDFTITFHLPEAEGNMVQGEYLSFDLSADAVQTKNNPNRLFN